MPEKEVIISPETIRAIRAAVAGGVTQAELARIIEVGQNAVSYWESGKTTPGPRATRELVKLANKYKGAVS